MSDYQKIADIAVGTYKAQQSPSELGILLHILAYDIGAQRIIEIGAGAGGTAWAWSMLPGIETVISIDIRKNAPYPPEIRNRCFFHQISGDSSDPAVIEQVTKSLYGYLADMVYVDGDHDIRHVCKDVASYMPLVRPGGLVVLHDTQGTSTGCDFNPGTAFAELRQRYRSVELVSRPGGPFGTGIIWVPTR